MTERFPLAVIVYRETHGRHVVRVTWSDNSWATDASFPTHDAALTFGLDVARYSAPCGKLVGVEDERFAALFLSERGIVRLLSYS